MNVISLLFFIFCFALQIQGQRHVYLYKDSLFVKLAGYENRLKNLDSLKQIYTQKIAVDRSEIQNRFNDLAKSYNVFEGETVDQLKSRMNSIDKEKLSLLQEEDKLLDIRIKSYNKILEDMFTLEIKPYISAVNNAISSYATKNKVDYVWIMEELQTKVLFVNPEKNITKIILDAANKDIKKMKL
jgi:Skp family chaperone for outer membrane proteins